MPYNAPNKLEYELKAKVEVISGLLNTASKSKYNCNRFRPEALTTLQQLILQQATNPPLRKRRLIVWEADTKQATILKFLKMLENCKCDLTSLGARHLRSYRQVGFKL